MKKDKNEIKVYICYAIAGLCFLIGIIRLFYGLFGSSDNAWYDYLIELLFLSFIGAMIIRLSATYKKD